MKKTLAFFMVIILISSLFISVHANDDITIYVNEELLISDVAPFFKNGRTMVPMRKIFEALDAKVEWEGSTQTINAKKDNTAISLQIDNPIMYNNEIAETLDVAPLIVNGSTFVPIRAVSQSLNADVKWFGNLQTIYINSPNAYNSEYNEYLDLFMMLSVPAGYQGTMNVEKEASVDTDICVQGLIIDVQIKNDNIYLIMNNRHLENEKIALCVSSARKASFEDVSNLFKNRNVSIGGRYLGVTAEFDTPTLSIHHVGIFETESFFSIDELTNEYSDKQAETAESSLAEEKTVIMYAADGRTRQVLEAEVESYESVGWYKEPVIKMYAADGRTRYVLKSEVDNYQSVGWYKEPVTKMYAADGRTTIVSQDKIYDYMTVGWYRTYNEAQEAYKRSNVQSYEQSNYQSTPQSTSSYTPNYDNQPNSGGSAIYRTPSGKRYHFDPNCGGKNSFQTTLEKAKNAGLTPCNKCAY